MVGARGSRSRGCRGVPAGGVRTAPGCSRRADADARPRLAGWRGSLFRFKASFRWYAFVVVWPLALGAFVVLIGSVAGGETPRWAALPALGTVIAMLIVQLVTSGLEEPGWRGFALPVLEGTHTFENAVVSGPGWAGWHVPYVVYLNREAPLWMLPLTIAGFAMSIVAIGDVHAWVYNATGAVPLNILLHGGQRHQRSRSPAPAESSRPAPYGGVRVGFRRVDPASREDRPASAPAVPTGELQ